MEAKRKITRFEDLVVFQKAMSLSKEIYRITSEGKFAKDWGLGVKGSGPEISNIPIDGVRN